MNAFSNKGVVVDNLSELGPAKKLGNWYPLICDFLDYAEKYSPTIHGAKLTPDGCFFDGVNDYLEADNIEVFGTHDKTVGLWIKSHDNQGYKRIVCSTVGGFQPGTFVIRHANGVLRLGEVRVPNPPIDEWNHYTWVKNASGESVYKNGAFIATQLSMKDYSEKVRYIGGNYVNGEEWFSGLIKDLRIYNKALSSKEIVYLYEHTVVAVGAASITQGSVYVKNQFKEAFC